MRISDWSSDVCSSDLFLFGFSEGVINSYFYKAIGDYFPTEECAKASSISLSAVAIAPACAGPLVGILVAHVQWQGMFLWMMVHDLIDSRAAYFFIPMQVTQTVIEETPAPETKLT